MIINDNKKTSKNIQKFYCEICDFSCSKKGDFMRHIKTIKHNDNQNGNNGNEKTSKNICDLCGRYYKYLSGLSRHKQSCFIQSDQSNNNISSNSSNDHKIDKDLVLSILKQNSDLIKENNDFKFMMMDVIKSGTHTTNNNNCNNKNFNLNFFLNETCKGAMNIMDFVNSLKLQLSDLEKMGDIGYVNGMSNIIIKNLKDMDITERPVHCTDVKREVLYVKDEDKWDKELSEKPKIRKAIKYVAHKNARLLQEFKEKHPDCIKSESKYSDTYNKLMIEAMGGKGCDDDNKDTKIIKRLAKEVIIDSKLDKTIDN
jgi:hypothetical protein